MTKKPKAGARGAARQKLNKNQLKSAMRFAQREVDRELLSKALSKKTEAACWVFPVGSDSYCWQTNRAYCIVLKAKMKADGTGHAEWHGDMQCSAGSTKKFITI
jgi:hypothetical protein